MKIGQKPELPGALAQTGLSKQTKTPAAAEEATKGASSASAAGVPVTVSMSARTLAQTAPTAGDFGPRRVKAGRAAHRQGTFTVDAGAIADKMLSNAQEILTRSRG